ncbi:hypothetical protein, partial [Streptomyces hebeiensis]|uniref:hypothetical protein n=1 Tax=Streptomyces hebeiensis TaxID=229486 RepID=UPI0031E1B50B
MQRQLAALGLIRLPRRIEQHPADIVRGRRVITGPLMTRMHGQVKVVQGERARHPQVPIRPPHVLQRANTPQQR